MGLHDFSKTSRPPHLFLDARASDKGTTTNTALQYSFFYQEGNGLTEGHPTNLELLSQVPFTREALSDFPDFLVNFGFNLIVNLYVSWNHLATLSVCYNLL